MSEVATINPQAITPASETDAVIHMIERAARDPSIDMDKMERLLAWQKSEKAQLRQETFDAALSACQSEIRRVVADTSNSQTRSRYASYAALDRVVRPITSKHDVAVTFDTADGAPENFVRMVARVCHAGHRETYHVDMPADGKGPKGNDVMTRTHATGSAMTYGRRYLLINIFNIAIGDIDDDDGNAAGVRSDTINEEQVVKLTSLIKETAVKSPEKNLELFLDKFRIECLPDLLARDYDAAIAALNAKKQKVAS